MTPEMEAQYRAVLKQALEAGYAVLKQGGVSLDAVQAAIRVMEDSPLFNAGKGAVFAHDGKNELDAAIMDGTTLKAGAVAAVEHIKNPIDLARLVMDKTPHVLLIGEGAEEFAKSQGMPLVPPSYFFTQHRWDELRKALKEAAGQGGNGKEDYPGTTGHGYGTVGAVALDRNGDLAAGTSTGGLTNKYYGRVGDSPIIGAGTYANTQSCGVSGTGTGEYLHPLEPSQDHLRPDAVQGHERAAGGGPTGAARSGGSGRHGYRRRHRHGPRRQHRHALQHRGHVSRLHRHFRQGICGNL